jgi:inhibitor of KinA sporulation pathway (predicted exonuclease)
MNYIIMDLESTCWKEHTDSKSHEIIEIGAVKLNDSLEAFEEFDSFIRPIINPQLSQFCKDLTNISQEDIDHADLFDSVFSGFLKWIGEESYTLVTWGDYDIIHIQIDCKRHLLKFPKRLTKKHINLKSKFAEARKIRPCGMDQALQMINIPLEGTHHRGIDDARNISKIFRRLNKKLI